MANGTPYTVRFVNHGYSSQERFATVEAALGYARRCGFQAAVEGLGVVVASWCPIGGTRWYTPPASCCGDPCVRGGKCCNCDTWIADD